MDVRTHTFQKYGAAVLHGTAQPEYRTGRKSAVYGLKSDKSETFPRKTTKHRRGKNIKEFFNKCLYHCCIATKNVVPGSSESPQHVSDVPGSSESSQHVSDGRQSTLDHEKDKMYKHLIPEIGRYPVTSNNHNWINTKDINISVKDFDNDANSDEISSDTFNRSESCHHDWPDHSASVETTKKAIHLKDKSSDIINNEIVSGEHPVAVHAFLPTSQMENNSAKGSVVQRQNVRRYSTTAMKHACQNISANQRMEYTPQHEKPRTWRQSVRERTLLSFSQSPKSVMKHFWHGRISQSHGCSQRLVNMMNEFFSSTFSDADMRRQTLNNCSVSHLRGYRQDDLADAGWFFDGRVLLTFCCALEMPAYPDGNPQNIHFSFSPLCSFAISLVNPVAELQNGNMETAGIAQDQLDAGEAFKIRFSLPVQVSDYQNEGVRESSTGADTLQSPRASVQGNLPLNPHHQQTVSMETMPAMQTSDASYAESLVTNRTPIASEQWQPCMENTQSDSSGLEILEEAMQNSQQELQGQLSMRINASAISDTQLLRDLENEARRNRSSFEDLSFDQGFVGESTVRYPHFGVSSFRTLTYKGWPSTHTQTPSKLSEAGFFYAGYGDSVLCFSCGIGVRHWEPTDNVWIEHARWRPSCAFVQARQGQHFIDAAVEMTSNNRHPTYREVKLEAGHRERAALFVARDNDLLAGIGRMEIDGNIPNQLCKVCFLERTSIIIMPCGHQAVCSICISHIISCPVCQGSIISHHQRGQVS